MNPLFVRLHPARALLFAVSLLAMACPLHAQNTHRAALVRASSQYFSAADSASLSVTADFTLEAWVKVRSVPATNSQYGIITKDGNTAQRSFDFWYVNEAGIRRVWLILFQTNSAYTHIYWNVDLGTTEWKHLAASVSIANPDATKAVLYVNGVSQGNGTVANPGGVTSIQDSTTPLRIGSGYTAEYFDGSIDDVRVWSVARTQARQQFVECGDF